MADQSLCLLEQFPDVDFLGQRVFEECFNRIFEIVCHIEVGLGKLSNKESGHCSIASNKDRARMEAMIYARR